MTRGDVFIQVMSELSGEPEKIIAEMLSLIKFSMPPKLHRFDEEISEAKARRLTAELMKEKEAILNWFLGGYRQFLLCTRTPQGNA